MNEDNTVRESVMQAIRDQRVQMRPRWHFVLFSALLATGALIILLTLLYVVSLSIFFLHQSGAWFAPAFGARGWMEFFRSLPWILILLLILFIVILEALVKRYKFVYKQPLMVSVGVILAIVIGGGALIAITPLHPRLAGFAREGALPPPIGGLYGPPYHMRAQDVYRGMIIGTTSEGLIISERGGAPQMILITRGTRLPYGEEFDIGDLIVVLGDASATDTIRAFGIREVVPGPGDDR